jgi:hypothetical protein
MRISVHLPAGAEGAGEARKALDELGRETSHAMLSTVDLLVSELVLNNPHQRKGDSDDAVLLEVETSSRMVHAEILDIGDGLVIAETPEQKRGAEWDVILLDELSDRWGTLGGSTGGIWFEIDRWSAEATPVMSV